MEEVIACSWNGQTYIISQVSKGHYKVKSNLHDHNLYLQPTRVPLKNGTKSSINYYP